MCDSILHNEVDAFVIGRWHTYTILHAMICLGQLTVIECHAPDCIFETRKFKTERIKGQHVNRECLGLDHIIAQQDNGSHRIENIRPVHNACNYSMARKGRRGSFLTSEAREKIRQGVIAAHQAGKYSHIYTPERQAKISAKTTGMKRSPEARARMSDSAKRRCDS